MGPCWGPCGACGIGACEMGPRAVRRLCGASGWTAGPAGGAYTPSSRANYQRGRARPAACGSRPSPLLLPPAHKSAPRTSPPKSGRGDGGNRWRSNLQSHAKGAGAGGWARGCGGAGAAGRQPAMCARTRPSPARPTHVPAPAPWIRRMHAAACRARAVRGGKRRGAHLLLLQPSPTGPLPGARGRARAAAWRENAAAEFAFQCVRAAWAEAPPKRAFLRLPRFCQPRAARTRCSALLRAPPEGSFLPARRAQQRQTIVRSSWRCRETPRRTQQPPAAAPTRCSYALLLRAAPRCSTRSRKAQSATPRNLLASEHHLMASSLPGGAATDPAAAYGGGGGTPRGGAPAFHHVAGAP